MTEFVSEVKTIPYNEEKVFSVLTNLNNLARIKDQIPPDKVQDFGCDRDSVSFTVKPLGQIRIAIVEKIPYNSIQLGPSGLPVKSSLWIDLESDGAEATRLKVRAEADLNPFIKGMVSKPLQQGIDKIAEVLAATPYGEIE